LAFSNGSNFSEIKGFAGEGDSSSIVSGYYLTEHTNGGYEYHSSIYLDV
jgi:hypothetical protein